MASGAPLVAMMNSLPSVDLQTRDMASRFLERGYSLTGLQSSMDVFRPLQIVLAKLLEGLLHGVEGIVL